MGDPLKIDGRRVRALNGEVELEAARAIRELHRLWGETDPDKYQRVMKNSLERLETIQARARDIEQICAMAATRGSYKKESS